MSSDSTSSDSNVEQSLASLLRLSDRLNSTFDLDNLLNVLVEQVLELTNAETGRAGLRTAQGMSCGHFLRGSDVVSMSDCRPGIGWPGWVLTNGTFYLTNDALNDTVIAPEIRDRFAVTSGMCIPVVDGERAVIAFFEVFNKKSRVAFTHQDLQNTLAAAQIASLAIQNGLTYKILTALAAFSRSLTMAGDLEQILEVVGHHLEINFHRGAAIFLPVDKLLMVRFRTSDFLPTVKELAAATWCWENGQEAGAGTLAVSEALARYVPLALHGQIIGVLGLMPSSGAWLSTQQRELLAGFIGQAAIAIEQGLLEQRLRRLRFLDESDRLQNALLAAISHEVRAPLAAITTAVTGMLNAPVPLDRAHERQLLQTAEYEAKRLHRLMNNLLNVTRLQAGVSRLKLEPSDLSDVVGAALEELQASTRKRSVSVEISPEVPLVPMDFELITQVLVNLLSNALKFSPPDQPIRLSGQIVNGELEVTVADRGRGVPEEELGRVFQKFHRLAESTSNDGLGLGLSICKEFVEAHRGRIRLENNPGGGTIARFFLPVGDVTGDDLNSTLSARIPG